MASIYSEIGSQPGVFMSIGVIVRIRLIVSIRALLYVAPCFCPPPAHIFSFSYAHPYIMQRLVNGSTDSSTIAERYALTPACAIGGWVEPSVNIDPLTNRHDC